MPADAIESVTLNFNIFRRWSNKTIQQQNIVRLYDKLDPEPLGYLERYGSNGWNSLGVTQSVLTYLSKGSGADFRFECFVKDSGISFYSAEGGYPSFLRITTKSTNAVPLPAGIWLMGSGLLGLLGLRRRLLN